MVQHIKRFALIPMLLLLVGAVIVIFGPDERTLGASIKSVYIHATFSVTGRAGLTLLGILGLIAFIRNAPTVERWAQRIGWVALALFSVGILASMISAAMTWGGVFLDEPRLKTATQIAALTLVVQILCSWMTNTRFRAILHIGLAFAINWLIGITELVMHPANPVMDSNARAIQMTFLTLFILCSIAAGWIVWQWEQTSKLQPAKQIAVRR